MALCSSFSLKRDILGKKGLCLLGLGLIYQVVFQMFLTHTLESEQEAEMRDGSSCSGEGQCLESQLFSLWHKETEVEADLLRDVEESPQVPEAGADTSSKRGAVAHQRLRPSNSKDTAAAAAMVERAQAEEEKAKAEVAALELKMEQMINRTRSREEERARSRAKFDRLYEETQKAVKGSGSSASDLQAQLQSQYDKMPSARGQVETSGQRFDRLVAQTERLLHSESSVSTWAQGLMVAQQEMEKRLSHLNDRHQRRFRGSRGEHESSLQWLPVKAWKERQPGHDTGAWAVPLTRQQLNQGKWKGAVPKVGCITAVPRGAQHRIMYVVNGFLLQEYEGASQLVIVYHQGDEASAKVVRGYADGQRIKGVAFRGEGDLPSTMALRYGAWSSDAEVIAQWDFDDVHHPDRLSLQVRALAVAKRPASLDLGDPEDGAPAAGREASIVGEAAWMREHWHPLLDEERGVLERAQAHNIVLVDAPELLLVDPLGRHQSQVRNTTAASTQASSEDNSLETAGIEACRSEIREAEQRDHKVELHGKIVEEVGADLGERFRALTEKRSSIAHKFAVLCSEADEEVDTRRRSELRQQAGRMAAIRAQLDEHFAALGKVFH